MCSAVLQPLQTIRLCRNNMWKIKSEKTAIPRISQETNCDTSNNIATSNEEFHTEIQQVVGE